MDLLTTTIGLLQFIPFGSGSPTGPRPSVPLAPTTGFVEAIFDASTLNEILKERDCTSIRFYNVKLADGSEGGTLVAIGTKADGTELLGKAEDKPYRTSMTSPAPGLSRSETAAACQRMTKAGHSSFSATATRDHVGSLLNEEGCQAIRVTPSEDDKGVLHLRLVGMKMDKDELVPMTDDPTKMRTSGEPCPAACGPVTNYANEAELKK